MYLYLIQIHIITLFYACQSFIKSCHLFSALSKESAAGFNDLKNSIYFISKSIDYKGKNQL